MPNSPRVRKNNCPKPVEGGFLHDLGSRWGLRLSFGLRFASDQGISLLVAMLLSFAFLSGGAEFSFVFSFWCLVLFFLFTGVRV